MFFSGSVAIEHQGRIAVGVVTELGLTQSAHLNVGTDLQPDKWFRTMDVVIAIVLNCALRTMSLAARATTTATPLAVLAST